MGFKTEMSVGDLDFEIEHRNWDEIKDLHLNIEWDDGGDTLEDMYPDASSEFLQQLHDKLDPPTEMSREQYWPSLAYAVDQIGEVDVMRVYVKVDPEHIAEHLENFKGDEYRRKSLEKAYKIVKENVDQDPEEAWYLIGEIFSSTVKTNKWWIIDEHEIEVTVPEKAYYCIRNAQFEDDQQAEFNQLEAVQKAMNFFAGLISSNDALPVEQPSPTFDVSVIDDINERIMSRFGLETEEELEEFMEELYREIEKLNEEEDEDEDVN